MKSFYANTIISKGLLLTSVMLLMAKIWGINSITISQPIIEDAKVLALSFRYLTGTKKEAAQERQVS